MQGSNTPPQPVLMIPMTFHSPFISRKPGPPESPKQVPVLTVALVYMMSA
jgi:hypothetical protein